MTPPSPYFCQTNLAKESLAVKQDSELIKLALNRLQICMRAWVGTANSLKMILSWEFSGTHTVAMRVLPV
jgi:hypothetical protein